MIFPWKISSENVGSFLTNLAESFLVAFRKKFCNKTFFQNKCFSSKSFPSIKLEVLATLLKLFAKSQKQIAQNPLIWGKFYFFKKFVFHQMFPWTIKMHFCHLCCNFFSENLKNLRLKAEELEKVPFFHRKCFSWRRCYGHVIAVLKNVPRNFESKVRIWFCSMSKNATKSFLFKKYLLIQNVSSDTEIQVWRNFRKMQLKVRRDQP